MEIGRAWRDAGDTRASLMGKSRGGPPRQVNDDVYGVSIEGSMNESLGSKELHTTLKITGILGWKSRT